MQYADYDRCAADPAEELERLLRLEFLTPAQAQVIPLDRIARFLSLIHIYVFGRVTDKNSAQAAALGSLLENGAYAEQYRRICYPARPEGFVIESGETARALFGSQMRLSPSKIDR